MQSLRRIFWLSCTFNFKIKAIYFPGVENVLADTVSRLHEPRGYERLMAVAGSQAALVLGYWYNLICLFTNSCVCGPSLYDAATYNMTCYE